MQGYQQIDDGSVPYDTSKPTVLSLIVTALPNGECQYEFDIKNKITVLRHILTSFVCEHLNRFSREVLYVHKGAPIKHNNQKSKIKIEASCSPKGLCRIDIFDVKAPSTIFINLMVQYITAYLAKTAYEELGQYYKLALNKTQEKPKNDEPPEPPFFSPGDSEPPKFKFT